MPRIGGGGPIDKPEIPRPTEQAGKAVEKPATETRPAENQKVVDSFQRVAPQITQKLEAMAGKKGMPGIQFTNEHLAQVAMFFAGMLRKKPGADRRERARMFARAFLSNAKLGRILKQADEQELERLYDLIGDSLDGSPVLAQLVDDVTEGARKINLG